MCTPLSSIPIADLSYIEYKLMFQRFVIVMLDIIYIHYTQAPGSEGLRNRYGIIYIP